MIFVKHFYFSFEKSSFDSNQSAYCKLHSAETTLKTLSDSPTLLKSFLLIQYTKCLQNLTRFMRQK